MSGSETTSKLIYHPDNWLSSMIERQAFVARFGESGSGNKPSSPHFAFSRVATADISSAIRLQDTGFYLVDTNIRFEAVRNDCNPKEPAAGIVIRSATPNDQESVGQLAESTFRFSRFHLDPGFSKTIANKIKAEWARNFFRGLRGKYLLLAERNQLVVGFVLLLNPTPDEFVIDLIGVDSEHQGRGIGRSLVSSLWTHFSNCRKITVGTQVANINSVRLYEKLGFRLVHSEYVFHGHF
jgi:ribosomal protein S18 acetylase RimI-like enzyme